jgi:uncharacterized membrane protein
MLHLFHPALVHVSVAFLVVGGSVEALALWARRDVPARWGGSLVAIGLASLVLTIASGYLAVNSVPLPEGAESLVATHERNGWILIALVFAAVFWKAWRRGQPAPHPRALYLALLVAIVALTSYEAWLGGSMVYARGIGVR